MQLNISVRAHTEREREREGGGRRGVKGEREGGRERGGYGGGGGGKRDLQFLSKKGFCVRTKQTNKNRTEF